MTSQCPVCSGPLTVEPSGKKIGEIAEDYRDCREVCPSCRIGVTNARPRPTFIRQDWRDGLWRPETADRLDKIADCSLNNASRKKKKARLAYERSEDLLTWNFFSYLEDTRALG